MKIGRDRSRDQQATLFTTDRPLTSTAAARSLGWDRCRQFIQGDT